MKHLIYRILIVFFLIGTSSKVWSQTSLTPGDIAILWNQTDTPDSFAFVTFVDMAAGTVIYFSDCGADAAGFNTPCVEGAFRYTVPAGGLTAGDIIRSDTNASDFTIYNDSRITGSFATSTAGDQIIAFQDASNPGGSTNAGNNPAFIFASNTASTLFNGDKTNTTQTGLPLGLSDSGSPRTALGIGLGPVDEYDNSVYSGSYDFTSGGIPAAKIAFTDPANYYGTDPNPPTLDPTYDAYVAAIPPAITLAASCASTDTTPPTPDVSPLPDVTAQCQVTSLTPPTATDNCGGTVTVTNNASLPITTQGTTVITWTYDDGNGNTSTQNQNVIIDDTTPPTPNAASLPNVTAQCQVTSLTPPTATDNCGGSVTVTNNASLPITTQGTTVVTWTYDDGNGNTTTQNQNIIIDDTTPPTPDTASLPDITAECEVTSLTPPTATDNCGGIVTVTNNASLPITSTTVVTWSYNDGNGNITFQNQNVIIDDTTPPVPDAASLPDITAECEVTSLTPPTATDNCGGTVIVTNNVTLPITTQGTTVIIWTFDDGNGNTATQNQNVIIDDITPPTPDVSPLPDVTAQCQVTSLTPPTATDNCGGTVTVTNNASLPITTQGTTVITWAYDDGNGNVTFQNQNVIIDDTTPPTPDAASLPNVTAQCQVTSLTPPTATDNCGGSVTVTNNASLPITTQGTTVITWTYDDGNGNTTTQNQNVIVDDTTPPTPDTASLPDITAECEVTSLTPPTATDNCGGIVTVTNNASLPITSTTVVTWSYNDGNGNITFQNQNVIIDDTTPPVPDAASLPDITAECEVTSLTPPTATDNCGGTVTVTNNVTLPITTQGTTIITWTFDDGNGNTATQTQNVIINDITNPIAVCNDLAVTLDSNGTATITANQLDGGSSDNCGITSIVIDTDTFTCANIGTNTVTLTVTDINGNTNSCAATVTVSSDGMAVASNNGPVCDGELIQLSETSGIATSWSWSSDGNASFDSATSQNPVVSNAADGEIFTVEITFSGGCTATASTTVTVFETATPVGEGNQEFCQDIGATLNDLSVNAAGEVLWYASAASDTPLTGDTALVNGSTYFASQFDASTGCESLNRLPVTVTFINCTDVSTFKKRAFSPNGDGINDTFTITELRNNYPNFKMEVYNRYGSLLYKGNASSPDWDGTSNEGSTLSDGIVPNGVYFFIVDFGDGETKPFQGIIYLNR